MKGFDFRPGTVMRFHFCQKLLVAWEGTALIFREAGSIVGAIEGTVRCRKQL